MNRVRQRAPHLRHATKTRIPAAVSKTPIYVQPFPPGFNPGGPIRQVPPATLNLQPLPPGFNPGGAEIPAYNQGGLSLSPNGTQQVPGLQPPP